MESKLEKLETISSYKINILERKRAERITWQHKLFNTIREVLEDLNEEEIIEHIQGVCEEVFIFEADRYMKEINKMNEWKFKWIDNNTRN